MWNAKINKKVIFKSTAHTTKFEGKAMRAESIDQGEWSTFYKWKLVAQNKACLAIYSNFNAEHFYS